MAGSFPLRPDRHELDPSEVLIRLAMLRRSAHHNSYRAHDDCRRSSEAVRVEYDILLSIRGDESLIVQAC